MKKIFLLISLFTIIITTPAFGAIKYKDKEYSSSYAASSTQKVNEVINDILDIEASSTVAKAKGIWNKTSAWFGKNGINITGIFKTIGNWFVVIVTWVVDLVKLGLTKL